MAITEILLSSMKQNWYFWVAKLGVTSIFRLPCKASLWLFDWVGGFENYKLWGFHCDIKGETLKPFLWRYTFFRVLFLCLRTEASFLLCFVGFIFLVILDPYGSLNIVWQTEWKFTSFTVSLTDLAMLHVFVILIKLNWGLMFFCVSALTFLLFAAYDHGILHDISWLKDKYISVNQHFTYLPSMSKSIGKLTSFCSIFEK